MQQSPTPPMGAAPVLTVRQVVKRFGGLTAVDHVDLTVARGEVVSVIGPNGSGKTTLFNLITGIYRPDAGQILLGTEPIVGLSPDRIARRGVSRTFQTIRLFNSLTVLENVLIGAHPALQTSLWSALVQGPLMRQREEEARAAAIEILSLFGQRLLPRLDVPAFSLSYANRRRTEIARALASRPDLLLLDEPTAGMNPAETAEIIEQIQVIHQRVAALIIIEHKLEVIDRLSDRVIVLDHGATIAEGTAEQVRKDERVIEAYLGQPLTTP
jgi:ABC-type branched-subunit amino acid transport system ATPase component